MLKILLGIVEIVMDFETDNDFQSDADAGINETFVVEVTHPTIDVKIFLQTLL